MKRRAWIAGVFWLAACVPPSRAVLDPADGAEAGDAGGIDAREASTPEGGIDAIDAQDAARETSTPEGGLDAGDTGSSDDASDASDADDAGALEGGPPPDAGCDLAPSAPPPSCATDGGLRPLRPLSSSWVTGPDVEITWQAPCGDNVNVEFCMDSTCTVAASRVTPSPQTGRATLTGLSRGRHFWRLVDTSNTTVPASPVWEFTVAASNGTSSSNSHTTLGSTSDFDQDGYSDLVIGAPGVNPAEGHAYVYYGAQSWSAGRAVELSSGDSLSNLFGAAVATAGDLDGDGVPEIVVGDLGGMGGPGRVHVFSGVRGADISPVPTVTLVEPEGNMSAVFGKALAGAIDVNADGYADLLVGEPGASNGGRVVLYLGAPGFATTRDMILIDPPEASARRFGTSIAGLQDVNHDGYDDFIVGAPGSDPNNTGAAYVYLGGPAGIQSCGPYGFPGMHPSMRAGTSVASIADYNYDGQGDFAIGGPAPSGDGTDGAVDLWLGNVGGQPFVFTGEYTGTTHMDLAGTGQTLSTPGDIDGDGQPEIVFGAPSTSTGGVVGVLGSEIVSGSSGLTTIQGDPSEAEQFGSALGSMLDLDGDGRGDLVVGAPGHGNGAGRVYIYFTSGSPIGSVSPVPIDRSTASAGFGAALN